MSLIINNKLGINNRQPSLCNVVGYAFHCSYAPVETSSERSYISDKDYLHTAYYAILGRRHREIEDWGALTSQRDFQGSGLPHRKGFESLIIYAVALRIIANNYCPLCYERRKMSNFVWHSCCTRKLFPLR